MNETGGGDKRRVVRFRVGAATWREVDDVVIGLHIPSSTYLEVNASGSVLWPLLVEGASKEQLSEELVNRYGISKDQARADVDSFVDACQQMDLLEP